jgi:uncharacterized protein (DUF362 family)
MSVDLEEVAAVIADDAGVTPRDLLTSALDRAGFWLLLERRSHALAVEPARLRIIIKPDLLAFKTGSPTATDPALVEMLIEAIRTRGYDNVALAASTDSSCLWAENREVLAIADLIGYSFSTSDRRPYDILDLGDDVAPAEFPPGALLHGSSISQTWLNADVRIVFAKNRTDELEGYALTLDSLLAVLPLADKDYYYRQRFDPGVVALELLRLAPPHFALIDAIVSSHGSGGSRDPLAISTQTIIASSSAVLADFAGALKMGVDPHVSRVNATVLKAGGLPARYRLDGNLAAYTGWRPVHPAAVDAVRKRDSWTAVSRTLKPWLQMMDSTSFPLKEPIDVQVNQFVAPRFADIDRDSGAFAMYVLANYLVGGIYELLSRYQVLNAKDDIRRRHVPLGLDLETFAPSDYESSLQELLQLRTLLRDTDVDNNGLRWRYVNEAVVFEIARSYPVPYDEFTSAVDVARTIQFMNDYLGGIVVPVAFDAQNRVTHQAERNLYLPQPNYLVLSGGMCIDVTKLEYVEYSADEQRMSWKTIKSENGSATYDDGLVTFSREGEGTRVSIFGRQLFTLPHFWQVVNLDLVPTFKAQLVTHAYTTFFQRTFSNFEALLEGRQIRIGKPWHDPAQHPGTEPLLRETVAKRVTSLLDKHGPVIARAFRPNARRDPHRVDELGFAHFGPQVRRNVSEASEREADSLTRGWAEFWAELGQAALRDIELQVRQPKASS